MAQKVDATEDVQEIKDALLTLEGQYGIPANNPLHNLLAAGLEKYADVLGVKREDVATMGGGTGKGD